MSASPHNPARGSRFSRLRAHILQSAGDGPPDLDELWRDFNRRLSGFFGRGGGGGDSRRDPGQGRILLAVILAALLLLWLATGFYIVPEGQYGVVSTFGRFDSVSSSGPRMRAPWPFQSHEIVDVFQQRKVDIGIGPRTAGGERLKEALMITQDENIVDMQFEVQYRVKDAPDGPRDYIYGSRFLRESREVEPGTGGVVKQCAESAMREVVGRRTMDDVLFGTKQEIADEVKAGMQTMLDRYKTGLQVTAVAIQNAQPPDQVQAAFDDASKAVQDRQRAINEGQAYFNDVVPSAKGKASRLLQEAEGYRVRVIETAEGDAARFRQVLAEYSKAPAVTRERMYIDTMQQIFSNTTKMLVDTKNGTQLLTVPLEQILQRGEGPARGGPAAGSQAAPPVPPSVPATPADSRPGDSARSRDREGR